MNLVITCEEFRRLSPATQKELLALLMGGDHFAAPMFGLDDYEGPSSMSEGGIATSGKRVVSINPDQATELLSNLAEKSRQTLKLFAVGERVRLDELVGDGRPYKDMNDLKRSFVGAVNRRLRTVVGHRSAVLFSSDRDRQRIRVLPTAAASLRRALDVAEPESNNTTNDFYFEDDFDTDYMPTSDQD